MNKFAKLDYEKRNALEKKLFDQSVGAFRREEISENFYSYEVQLQEIRFRTAMSDEELKAAAECTVDLLEALKDINNSGVNREKLMEIEESVRKEFKDQPEAFCIMKTVQLFESDEIIKIRVRLAEICRVGGAYFTIISNPGLSDVILAVYEVIVDRFDEPDLYEISAWFLLRGIMHMNSNAVEKSKS